MSAAGSQLLSRIVAERLEAYVLSRGYQPGQKLPSEREFGELFGVSRTALREAVKLLNQKGLVQSSVGRGLYVAEPNGGTLASSIDTLLQLKQGRVDTSSRSAPHSKIFRRAPPPSALPPTTWPPCAPRSTTWTACCSSRCCSFEAI